MKKSSYTLLQFTLVALLSLNTSAAPQAFSLISRVPAPLAAPSPLFSMQDTGGVITKANWQRHPKIKEVRAVVQAVNRGMSRKALKVRTRAFEYCEPYEDTRRTIATDRKGRVRFYANEGGSDDSALKWEHYYDDEGRLRFVLITGGAVNGSRLKHRIYFDEKGARIWEDHAYKKGPRYTFPEVWPDDQLQIKDADKKFAAKGPCKEK